MFRVFSRGGKNLFLYFVNKFIRNKFRFFFFLENSVIKNIYVFGHPESNVSESCVIYS